MVTKNMRVTCLEDVVQQQCSKVVGLICELERQFPTKEPFECNWGDLPTILDGSRGKNNISKPLGYFSSTFGAPQGLGGFWCVWWSNIKPHPFLWTICWISKLTMQKHCQGAMLPPHNYNSTTRMWQLFKSSTILNHHILEWIILVMLCMVMVERLGIHLDNEIQMCSKVNIVLLLW